MEPEKQSILSGDGRYVNIRSSRVGGGPRSLSAVGIDPKQRQVADEVSVKLIDRVVSCAAEVTLGKEHQRRLAVACLLARKVAS